MSEFYEYDRALSKIIKLEEENALLKARVTELEEFSDKVSATNVLLTVREYDKRIEELKQRIAELEKQLAEALPYLINEKVRKGQFEEL